MPDTKQDPDELSLYGVDAPTVDEAPVDEAPKKKPIRENRPVPAKPKEEGPEVWFSCRAKEGCSGKQARLLLRVKKPGGGALLRYRCLTCKQIFSLST
jgi:hypothetical protein